LATFYGDVRKYFIFKSDFQHAIEHHSSERDAITVLLSCLGPEPAKLIEGITTDLKTAWNYLDHNYGDPRIISDTITTDLEIFKPLPSGDDHRFCDFVNLVRKSSNILKEVKRPQDNISLISLIERKMTPDDLKVLSRHIYA
jgi:putative heme iron utilization protein